MIRKRYLIQFGPDDKDAITFELEAANQAGLDTLLQAKLVEFGPGPTVYKVWKFNTNPDQQYRVDKTTAAVLLP